MDYLPIIAVQLRQFRLSKKLTQEQFASMSGFSRNFILRVELQKVPNLGITDLAKLFEVLGFTTHISFVPNK